MNLSERAIERPRLIILGAVLLCILGLAGIFTLPKERTPRVKLPVIVVAIPNLGAPPTTNETEIVRKVEDQVGTLSDLKADGGVRAEAVNGAAVMQFIFDEGIDVKEAKRDVESLFNRVKGEFPADAQKDPGPLVNDIAFEDWPIIQIFVAGGVDGVQRRDVAERLQEQIEQVPGIAGVDIFGGLEEEIHIEVNPHLMTLYGFNYEQVEQALRRANIEAPSGEITSSGGAEVRVRTPAKFESIDAIAQLPVGASGGRPVVLADIAKVQRSHKQRASIARYGGQDAAVLLARAKTDIDVLATANEVQKLVDQFVETQQAAGTSIGTVRSQAREIGYMINQLGTSAIYGTILVVFILWVFLGWRNAALISISLPMAILGTGAIMWCTKRTITPDLAINNMTLFATILVVGMVVDGCIIVGENIYRHRELGHSPVVSAKRGISEVGGSLIGAYLTTFAAFFPMYLVRGVMGDFMELMPTVVLFALCSAMLVDHFLLPVLSMYWMKLPRKQREALEQQRRREAEQPAEALTPEQIEIQDAEKVIAASKVKQTYGRMLAYAMKHRLLVLVLALLVTATPVVLWQQRAIGFEFFPETDMPIIEVTFELPLGASMEKRTTEVAQIVEAAVNRAVREEEWHKPSEGAARVKAVTTMGSPGALNTRLDMPTGSGPEFGKVYVELELAQNRKRTARQVREAIKKEIPPLPGVIVRVTSPSEGPPAGAPIMLRVLGHDDTPLPELAQRAAEIEKLLGSIAGVSDVTSDYRLRPELTVKPKRTIARMFDIDTAQIVRSVTYAVEGVRAGEVDFGTGDAIDLRVRNQSEYRDQQKDLMNLPLRSPTGQVVNVEQVADVERVASANVIRHYDQKRMISIRAELDKGVLVDDIKATLVAALRPDLTAGQQRKLISDRGQRVIYSDPTTMVEFGGEIEIRDDAMEDLSVAMIVAIGLMMIILTIKFNSFIQPLIVLFSVPLSLVGVSIGLMLCGFHFSISALIGLVALSGIVVNDAIVLVDFINRMVKAGVPAGKAVVYAGQLRIRPIFLTTVTTIGGMLPLALNMAGGGEFWQPLTVTIMFGLAFATLLQLFIIPLLCYTFAFRSSVLDPMKHRKYAGEPGPAATAAPA